MAQVTAPVTAANFNDKVAGVVRSFGTARDNIQNLIIFACVYANDNNGNFLYASTLVRKLTGVKGMNISTLVAYMKAHCAVTYGKDKVGDLVFRPIAEAKREGRPLVDLSAIVATKWYDHGKATKEPTVKTMEQLISYLEKWAGADTDSIDPLARDMAKMLAQKAVAFKNERIIEEVRKAA